MKKNVYSHVGEAPRKSVNIQMGTTIGKAVRAAMDQKFPEAGSASPDPHMVKSDALEFLGDTLGLAEKFSREDLFDWFRSYKKIELENLALTDTTGRTVRGEDFLYSEVVGKDIGIVQLPNLSKALVLPTEDLSDVIDAPSMWGSRVYSEYDFSQDEDQNTVKITLAWSKIHKDAYNENPWVTLEGSFMQDSERYYVGTLDNIPMYLDIDAVVEEFDVDNITDVPIIFKATDILCVLDREGLDYVLEAQEEGRLPKMGTPEWESLSMDEKLSIAHAGRKEGVVPKTRVLN